MRRSRILQQPINLAIVGVALFFGMKGCDKAEGSLEMDCNLEDGGKARAKIEFEGCG